MVSPESATADRILARLVTVYPAAADPAKAPAMVAYMRHQFPYLGITAPIQRRLEREVLAGLPRPGQGDLHDVVIACWAMDQREYQYFGCQLLRRHVRACDAELIDTVRTLIITKSWWDTVDTLASQVVAPLVAAHPALVATMDRWSTDENMWLARTAIIHQLTYKTATDAERLFRYCAVQAGHKDFFVRKAIGWALREYAKTDPDAVIAFVEKHRTELSGLSIREALRRQPQRVPGWG